MKPSRAIALLAVLALFVLAASGCASSDASLQTLTIGSCTLGPAFIATTFDYATTKNASTIPFATQVTAMPTDSKATMRMQVGTASWVELLPGQATNISLPLGVTDVVIEVTAEDGTIRLYEVVVTITHVVYA